MITKTFLRFQTQELQITYDSPSLYAPNNFTLPAIKAARNALEKSRNYSEIKKRNMPLQFIKKLMTCLACVIIYNKLILQTATPFIAQQTI